MYYDLVRWILGEENINLFPPSTVLLVAVLPLMVGFSLLAPQLASCSSSMPSMGTASSANLVLMTWALTE